MKRQLLLISALALFGFNVQAQKYWKYDFGTATGNLSPSSAAGIASSNDGSHVHGTLAAPQDQQIARIWTGNSNVSGFTLVNTGTIGSGSRLLFKTPPTTSTSKFSILNIAGTSVMSIGFKMKFQSGTNADYRFVVGRDASTFNWTTASGGTQFSNNINFNEVNPQPAILMMHWNLSGGTYQLSVREKLTAGTPAVSGFKTLDPTLNPNISFVNGGEYYVQIYANNNATPATYDKTDAATEITTTYSIAAQASHIWVNGVRLIYDTNNYDFFDVGNNLAAGVALNAFVFLGYNATNNDAQVYLDNFTYANYLTDLVPLPIKLTSFNAVSSGHKVKINWATATETNNSHFEILRSENGSDFNVIATVKGSGNTNTEQLYSYTDQNPLPGNSYYQLRQVDFDGNSSLSKVVVVKTLWEKTALSVIAKPNQQAVEFAFMAENNGVATIKVSDLSGKKVLEQNIKVVKGQQVTQLPFNLPKGLYIGSLQQSGVLSSQKFIF
ncbi:T9SS type A sorting domain-containing protein [Pedobacter chitinilyticus]|uniref:T9SS type A sorting domain-containing protein n=1 Tax=Pedobacter chitinilyticus TaxID=2233776 RepID=A0A3S3Q1G3_9SPHI|nr:T9SS type A sorting domain-containing protein [Pedobacter chitinilyticus]RWU10791.1 T9SS type A sorting domain-containing protein [Pedobacter chitinilyticus]